MKWHRIKDLLGRGTDTTAFFDVLYKIKEIAESRYYTHLPYLIANDMSRYALSENIFTKFGTRILDPSQDGILFATTGDGHVDLLNPEWNPIIKFIPEWDRMIEALEKGYELLDNVTERTEETITSSVLGSESENKEDTITKTQTSNIERSNQNTGETNRSITSSGNTDSNSTTNSDSNSNTTSTGNGSNTTSNSGVDDSSLLYATDRVESSDTATDNSISAATTSATSNTSTDTDTEEKQKTSITDTEATTGTVSDTGSNSSTVTRNDSKDESSTRNLYRHGNIGVTSSQQMITQEMILRQTYNIIDIIARDIVNIYCLPVYDEV